LPRPDGPRVLVVDDEESIRASLRMILEFERYRVDEGASGRQALRRLESSLRFSSPNQIH